MRVIRAMRVNRTSLVILMIRSTRMFVNVDTPGGVSCVH